MNLSGKRLGYALIEDEYITRQYIKKTIFRNRPNYYPIIETDSISGISSLLNNGSISFIISGVLLGDGNAIAELKRIGYSGPIVVFTRYKEFLPALDYENSIIFAALKPVSENIVEESLRKVEEVLFASDIEACSLSDFTTSPDLYSSPTKNSLGSKKRELNLQP